MLTVATALKPGVHGLGVFASEPIWRGDVVWSYRDGIDVWVTDCFVKNLPSVAEQHVRHFAPLSGGYWLLSFDNARFINHSDQPNIACMEHPDRCIALRDIKAGEELVEDYRTFDESFEGRNIGPRLTPASRL